jgi:hypothetical protein
MNRLAEITEQYAGHPLSEQFQQMPGNANVNAQRVAVRSCPLDELPGWLRKPRAELDAAETTKTAASRKVDERLRDWETYQTTLAEIADRKKHLDFAQGRLALAQDAAAQLQTNFMAIQRIGQPQAWTSAVELIRDAGLCKELVRLLPAWIEAESAAIAALEAAASELEKRYGT